MIRETYLAGIFITCIPMFLLSRYSKVSFKLAYCFSDFILIKNTLLTWALGN